MPLSFIDLFAGIGGTRLAFEKHNGMTCVFSSEWDQHSQKTSEANFGEKPSGDITQISANEIPDFDVLVAGFPCQPFSSIGKRQGFEQSPPAWGQTQVFPMEVVRENS
jgi:DNA (cytosine-5)-methyltransferase 1